MTALALSHPNVIGDFIDDANMLNVTVSRAVKSLTVVTSQDPRNDKTNYGDLARYIQYHNCEVIDSTVRSVFDLLYKGYAQECDRKKNSIFQKCGIPLLRLRTDGSKEAAKLEQALRAVM